MKALALSLTVLLCAPVVFAADPPTHYRVLVPLFLSDPAPGAFGSLWKSEFAVHNPTTSTFFIERCLPNTGCLLFLDRREELRAGETQTELPFIGNATTPPRGTARVLWIRGEGGDPSALAFQLRAADISRLATNAGTEVPIVRQEQFRTSTLHLLNIPVDARFRLTLRVYEMQERVADFRVRVYDQSTGDLAGTSTLRLEMPAETGPYEPGYAQIGDLSAFLSGAGPLPELFRVEIEPLTANSQFWAIVSITNNDTQHFTLVTPQ